MYQIEQPTVALFSTNFLPYSQTFIYEEIRAHRRYQTEVFAWRRLLAERFPYEPVHMAGLLYGATRYSPHFDHLFRTRHYALIHAHFGPGGVYALRYASKFQLPLVVTFHGYDVPLLNHRERFLPIYWPYALHGKTLLNRMTLGLCASTDLRDLLVSMGVPQERLVVHRLGIDLSLFQHAPRADSTIQVAMIGRFVEKKGFEYGLEAFANVVARVQTPLQLTIVGHGERKHKLEQLCQRLGVNQHVRFVGSLPAQEVANLLRTTDILLAPSVVAKNGDRESGVIVVKEACASGVVPIGTYHGGIPEIIDDQKTGFLVAERDTQTLAQRLEQLVTSPELRAQMSAAARHKMEAEYDNHVRVAALEDLYDEARSRYRSKAQKT